MDNVDDTEGVSHETGDGVEPDCHVKTHLHDMEVDWRAQGVGIGGKFPRETMTQESRIPGVFADPVEGLKHTWSRHPFSH